jgi:hypothetical protein
VQRLPRLEHHVVGHVDGERHRTHAAQQEPPLQPRGGLRTRVQPGDGAQDQPVGSRGIGDLSGVAGAVDREGLDVGRVVEVHPEGGGRLARDPPDGQAVAPVGRHRDVEHLVAQVEQCDRVVAG